MIVVDASLFVARLLNERQDREGENFWQLMTTQPALVPANWPNEVANALRRAVRTNRLQVDDVVPAARELFIFDIRVSPPPDVHQIADLAQEALAYNVSVYDLQYLRLAQTNRVALATIDAGMRKAAGVMNIALFPA